MVPVSGCEEFWTGKLKRCAKEEKQTIVNGVKLDGEYLPNEAGKTYQAQVSCG